MQTEEKFRNMVGNACPYKLGCLRDIILTTFEGSDTQSLDVSFGIRFAEGCFCDRDDPEFFNEIYEAAVRQVLAGNNKEVDFIERVDPT